MTLGTGWLRALGTSFTLAVGLAVTTPADAGTVPFDGEGHAENPVWSPDGHYLAFEVNRFAGDTEMFVSEVSGDIPRQARKMNLPGSGGGFGAGNRVTINAAWHPQPLVLFEGSNQGGQFRIYYAVPGDGNASEMIKTSDAPGDLTFPAMRPDGGKMAFISDQTGNGDIRIRDTGTEAITQLTNTEGSEMFPEYSDDGSKLLFTRKRNSVEAVYMIDLASGEERTISSGNADRTRPTFAGDRIVFFSSDGSDGWDLVSTDMNGQGRQTLARGVRLPVRGRPQTTPDGRYVAYTSADPTQSSKVTLVRADGSSRVDIPTGFVACGEPAVTVSADGRTKLAFTALPDANAAWRFLSVIDITGRI